MTRVLIVGLPRSGTTWVGRCLGYAAGTRYVNEPDNENIHPYAVRAKRRLGRYPILGPDDEAPADYERLWAVALKGGEQPAGLAGRVSYRLYNPIRWQAHPEGRSSLRTWGRMLLAASAGFATPGHPVASEHLVVKSVFLPFAIDWLLQRWHGRVVLALRDPLNTIASWWQLGWRDVLGHHPAFASGSPEVPQLLAATLSGMRIPPLAKNPSSLQRLAWQMGLLSSGLLSSYRRHPDWILARHDALCLDPVPAFKGLFERIALPWSVQAEEFVLHSDRPGAGAFDTTRVAHDERERWRERLTDDQVSEVRGVLDGFDLGW